MCRPERDAALRRDGFEFAATPALVWHLALALDTGAGVDWADPAWLTEPAAREI